jgi:hypothetical protein
MDLFSNERKLKQILANEDLKEQVPAMLDTIAQLSVIMHSFYKSLINVGFTDEQAFEIVKEQGIFPRVFQNGVDNNDK